MWYASDGPISVRNDPMFGDPERIMLAADDDGDGASRLVDWLEDRGVSITIWEARELAASVRRGDV